ncbi:MAG: hypothetical protein JW731_11270 [Bacteroidales bacterium]|nr:hypothetical protein [Bacteroidales bacterium]
MKRIFAKSTLREFWENYPDSEQYLKLVDMELKPIKTEMDYREALKRL